MRKEGKCMQSITLAKCIAIAESHFLYTPYKNLSIDKIYGVDGIGNKASRICHYCSVDVLKSILETSSLRFSDVRFLNDSTEFVEIIPLLKFVVEQGGYEAEFKDIILDEALIRKLKSYKQGYVGRKKDTNELVKKNYRTYTCSFSTEQDSLFMWNYYATSGNGVNITFDFAWNLFNGSNDSNTISSERLANDIVICRGLILYKRSDKEKCVKELLDKLYEVYTGESDIENCKNYIKWAFKEAINNMRCFFKNESFSSENEYRVVLKMPEELLTEKDDKRDEIIKIGQFKRGNILIPYIDYKFNEKCLKEITLNPYIKEQESLFELGIKELLWQNEIHDVMIYHSGIPMRKYF